jgi:hypothetical protein
VNARDNRTLQPRSVCSLECLAVFKPPQQSASIDAPVLAVVPLFGAVAAAMAGLAAGSKRAGVAQSTASVAAAGSGSLRQSLRSQEPLIVVTRGPSAHILNSSTGAVLCTLTHSRQAAARPATAAAAAADAGGAASKLAAVAPRFYDCVACAVAPQGKVIYLLTEDRAVLVYTAFNSALAVPSAMLEAATQGEPLGLAHHPHRNLLATFAGDGAVRLFKP